MPGEPGKPGRRGDPGEGGINSKGTKGILRRSYSQQKNLLNEEKCASIYADNSFVPFE